jgi:hypothetical protein
LRAKATVHLAERQSSKCKEEKQIYITFSINEQHQNLRPLLISAENKVASAMEEKICRTFSEMKSFRI